ncbi:MAG: hypothetical protein ABI051_16760 [Vicinamibacterales bacterium]
MSRSKRLVVGIVAGVAVGAVVGTAAGLLKNAGWNSLGTVLVLTTPGIIGGLFATMMGSKASRESVRH